MIEKGFRDISVPAESVNQFVEQYKEDTFDIVFEISLSGRTYV